MMRASGRLAYPILAVMLSAGAPTALPAQTTGAALDSVEAALDQGRPEDARTALEHWFTGDGERASAAEVSRATYYRARASLDSDSAETDYIRVAVSGDDDYAPLAWLRLAQLHLATGDSERSKRDLEMLRADYPGSVIVPASWMWTGVARSEAGDGDGACDAWREAESAVELAGSAADGASGVRESDLAAVSDLAAIALMSCDPDAPPVGAFTVQLGAFRERGPADDLRRRVDQAGARARVEVPAEPDGWFRVRAGQFADRATAAELAVQLRERGFEAIVVPAES